MKSLLHARVLSGHSSVSRKYLGDKDDPHFIPTSPIISRQKFTPQEEDELTRVCTLVLSNVQHSDDDEDDTVEEPLAYLAPQIIAKRPDEKRPQDKSIFSNKSSIGHSSQHSQSMGRIVEESATPSEISRRDTMSLETISTQVTSPEITPGDTGKRFSDAGRYTARTSSSSNARSAFKPHQRNPIYPALNEAVLNTRTTVVPAAKSMSSLPTSVVGSKQGPVGSSSRYAVIRMSNSELNKSLPVLPKPSTPYASERQTGFSRLFKTVKGKRTVVTGIDSTTKIPAGTTMLPTSSRSKYSLRAWLDRRRR